MTNGRMNFEATGRNILIFVKIMAYGSFACVLRVYGRGERRGERGLFRREKRACIYSLV